LHIVLRRVGGIRYDNLIAGTKYLVIKP